MSKKIHYCGSRIHGMIPGWPVCGSGDFAHKVREEGNQDRNRENVTCKRCLKLLKEADLGIEKYEAETGKKWKPWPGRN